VWPGFLQAFFALEAPTHSKYDAWRAVVDAALTVDGSLPQKDPAAALLRTIGSFVHIGTKGAFAPCLGRIQLSTQP
jgi:hypothetical protein